MSDESISATPPPRAVELTFHTTRPRIARSSPAIELSSCDHMPSPISGRKRPSAARPSAISSTGDFPLSLVGETLAARPILPIRWGERVIFHLCDRLVGRVLTDKPRNCAQDLGCHRLG